jgi:dihydrofolate reductase
VRDFLRADLIDFMHLMVVPITLGRGASLWDGTDGVEERFTIETTTSPSGVTHQLWNRKSRG